MTHGISYQYANSHVYLNAPHTIDDVTFRFIVYLFALYIQLLLIFLFIIVCIYMINIWRQLSNRKTAVFIYLWNNIELHSVVILNKSVHEAHN